MAIESTQTVIGTKIPTLGGEITISKRSEDAQDSGQICAHVETKSSGIDNLGESDLTVAGKVTVVSKQVESGARTTAVTRTRCLERVSWLGTQVTGINT